MTCLNAILVSLPMFWNQNWARIRRFLRPAKRVDFIMERLWKYNLITSIDNVICANGKFAENFIKPFNVRSFDGA